MIVWDSASTHRAKDMKKFLVERRIDQIMFPAGMTAYLQTLDIAINRPLKDHLRKEINDCIENRMIRNDRGNFVKPKLEEIVTCVANSWNKITDGCVNNALKAGYLDKKFSSDETFIARHETVGAKIRQKIQLNRNSVEISKCSYLQDIPEDDDIVIFK